MKKKLFIFFISFILLTIISTVLSTVSMDGVWNYGFSYNIANGLIPYKDFNMIIGPFYNLLMAGFIKLFGNYIIVFNIANSLIISIFIVLIYQKLGLKTIYIILYFGFLPVVYGYNTFCAFLLIGILLLDDSNLKYKNLYIGLLVGMLIMTKHNIGLIIAIIAVIINKDKIRLIIGMIIPIALISLYLLYNNSFIFYIDFCYLGLGNFLDNFHYDIVTCIIIPLVIIWLIKNYLNTKDNKILYLLGFQIINIPLFDVVHSVPSLLPVLYYYFLVSKNNRSISFYKLVIIIGFIEIQILSFSNYVISFNNTDFIYTRNSKYFDNYIEKLSNYILNYQDNHKVYTFHEYSYLIKLYLDQSINTFDLINKGNLGSDENKYIKLIENNCKKEKCMFILHSRYFDKDIYTQLSPIFKNYVLENGYYFETLPSGDRVYVNYKIKPEDNN